MAMLDAVKKITSADLFSRDSAGVVNTGVYVGRPFHIDFDRMFVLMAELLETKSKRHTTGLAATGLLRKRRDCLGGPVGPRD